MITLVLLPLLAGLLCPVPRRSLVDVDPALRDLAQQLRGSHPATRRRAVSGLAKLASPGAWRLILTALSDDESQVASEAQRALADWDDPRGLLLGKEGLAARDEDVRVRAAESFGRRSGSVAAKTLARRLDPRDVPTARMLLWSIERLAAAGRLAGERDALTRRVMGCLARNRPPGLRTSALAALVHLDPERSRDELRDALTDRERSVRCAALALSAGLDPDGQLERLRSALGDADASVRAQAADGLFAIGDMPAFRLLVEGLERETRPRLQARFVELLQRGTGRRYRTDVRPWRDYVATLDRTWRRASAPAEPTQAPNRSVAFGGMAIVSDRVCFLIDFSGSLWHRRSDGSTPKDIVDRELANVLERLPVGTEFNVVPYTDRPHPWKEDLVPKGRRREVADALKYFGRCRETGPGSFFEAALFALSDERVDTVVVLTDGAPTGGFHWNLDLLFAQLSFENRYRKVQFDAVLVDAAPHLQGRWRAFCESSGGHVVTVGIDATEPVLRPAGAR